MFEHSVKVPRHFKVAANIFKKVSTEGGSVKTLLYDDKLRHFRTNVLYALLTETIKHAAEIDKLFETSNLLKNEPRLDPWLAKVLATELLFGKKTLPGKSKPEQTIISYKEQFEKYRSEHQDDFKTEAAPRPRYVRINTNLLTTSDAIRVFQDEGYRFIRCTSGSYDDYLKQIQELTEYDFTQDYHVKTMFVFSAGTKLHEHELYLENKIVLQDKATAMAVHLLAPPSGSVVLDMCAAPGMKTTQLAAYMRNQGKIYAVERNERRYQTLCDFVEKSGSKCVETFNKDSLEIKRGDYDDVEYILLDPSCSGSGMQLSVHNYVDATRLSKLTSLQEKFLKHAMNSFPNAKRIVYSTCSLFPEENERVITNVVKTSRSKWRVQDVKEMLKGQWNNFGSGMYGSMGTRCLYAKPESDLTTGFFLAVLDRDQKEIDKGKNVGKENGVQDEAGEESLNDRGKKKKRGKEVKGGVMDNDGEKVTVSTKKKKKLDKERDIDKNSVGKENGVQDEVDTEENESNKKVKKKKRAEEVIEENVVENDTEEVTSPEKKRRKNKHLNADEDATDNIVAEANSVADSVDATEAKVSKKKKKKDKNRDTNNAEEIISQYEVNKSKKNNDDYQQVEEQETPKKKKKKQRVIEVNDTELQETPENIEELSKSLEFIKKKNKKKRNKDIEAS